MHALHAAQADPLANVPAAQWVHASEPAPAYLPDSHAVCTEFPEHLCPAVQIEHVVRVSEVPPEVKNPAVQ